LRFRGSIRAAWGYTGSNVRNNRSTATRPARDGAPRNNTKKKQERQGGPLREQRGKDFLYSRGFRSHSQQEKPEKKKERERIEES